jgi:signal transduction histidine kinase
MFCVSLLFSKQALRPVEAAWEKQKQFVANASHELKTPLTIILSNIGALKSSGDETVKSQMKWIDRISSGCDRMNGLIQQLLQLARMDAVPAGGLAEPVNLSEVTQALISEFDGAAAQKKLRVSSDIRQSLIVSGDGEKIRRLLTILLDNAVKYAEEGGAVEVALKKSSRGVECAIKNSGEGIAPAELPLIFERFYRAGRTGSNDVGGYGLGLSVAKALAEQIGGKIQAESSPGEWTAFTLSIPLQHDCVRPQVNVL